MLAAVAVALLLAGSGCRARARRTRPSALDARVAPTGVVGHWVWRGWAEDDRVVQEVTDDDLTPLVGPAFRADCPFDVECTRFGVHLLALGADGELWLVVDAKTSSDYQHVGRFRREAEVLHVDRERYFSCAHPDVVDARPTRFDLRYRLVGDDLWIASEQPGWLEPGADARASHHWIVFRRVEREAFLRRYLIRRCQDGGHEPRCQPGCTSEAYGR